MITAYNEQDLIKGLAAKDSASIEIIYKNNFSVIQALILSNNGNADDARDIFQEALLVLYEKVRSGTFDLNCLIRTYLYSVARRLWLKRLKQLQQFSGDSGISEEIAAVEDDVTLHKEKQADFNRMLQSLEKLGEPCKSLIKACYIEKKSMGEIATEFGYTNADNAKNQKYKCLTRLKKLFFTQYKNDA